MSFEQTVSVIIPTLNRAATLGQAIESVQRQTLPPKELIIVDDGSDDDTQALVAAKQSSSDIPIRYIFQKQKGVSAARNVGIANARGDWIALLDSDDQWLPDKLTQQNQWADKHRVIHGEEIWIRNGKRVNPCKKHAKTGGQIFRQCLPLCVISPSAVVLHKSVFEDYGNFKEDYPVCEDYDLWLRICATESVGFVSDPVITKFGGHSDQLSRRFVAMDYWRVLSLALYIDHPDIPKETSLDVCRQILKKTKVLLNGYIKHNNMGHYSQMAAIRQRAQERLDDNN